MTDYKSQKCLILFILWYKGYRNNIIKMGKNKNNNKSKVATTATAAPAEKKETKIETPVKTADPVKTTAPAVNEEVTKPQVNKPKVIKPKEEVQLVETETVETVVNRLSGNKKSTTATMSPDSKVTLASLIQKTFIEDPNAPLKYAQIVLDEMDNIKVDLIVLSLLDLRGECQERGIDLNIMVANDRKFLQLEAACKMLGVEMGKPKLLENQQLGLNFAESKVDANMEKTIANERAARKAIEEHVPELDPSKITTDEEVNSALEYQMRSSANGIQSLIATVEWLRNYRLFKTKKTDERLALDDKPIGYWVDEILTMVKPTLLLTGIGRAIRNNIVSDKNPVFGHTLTRMQATLKDGTLLINDKQIANLVVTLLKATASFALKNEPEEAQADALKDDTALATLINGSGALVDQIVARGDAMEKKVFNVVLKSYYPNAEPSPETTEKVRNKIGQILNLYLPESDRMEQYPEDFDMQEYPISSEPVVIDEGTKSEDKKKN